MSFFKKMKTLMKSEKPTEESNVSAEVENIKDAKIGNFVIFGFNDLMELANLQFEVVSTIILEREHNQNTELLTLNSPGFGEILIDHKSDRQHIYVYKEMFFNDLISLTKEDSISLQEYLECSADSQTGLKFDSIIAEDILSEKWIQNKEQYYGLSKEEVFKHIKNSENYVLSNQEGDETLVYSLQSSDREYRLLMTVSLSGDTKFYCGRRIEPKNIKNIYNK